MLFLGKSRGVLDQSLEGSAFGTSSEDGTLGGGTASIPWPQRQVRSHLFSLRRPTEPAREALEIHKRLLQRVPEFALMEQEMESTGD